MALVLPNSPVEVSYDVAGEGVSTAIFLHGITSSRRIWEPSLAAVPQGASWIAVDFPGFGDATLPRRRQTLEDYLVFLDAFLAPFPRPVHLVGHSFGAMVAALYALSRPEAVDRLLLVAPAGFVPPRHALQPLPAPWLNRLWLHWAAWRDEGRSLLLGVGLDPTAIDAAWRNRLAHGLFRAREAFRLQRFYETPPLGRLLADAGRTATYLLGGRDPLFPLPELLPKLGPGPCHILWSEGHAPMVGAPRTFTALLRTLLAPAVRPQAERCATWPSSGIRRSVPPNASTSRSAK